MGLLDDAIRQHLELKRRHGAHPSDVAKLEHEAFGPSELAEPVALPEADAAAATERDREAVPPYDALDRDGEEESAASAPPAPPTPEVVAPPEPPLEPPLERRRAAPVEPAAVEPAPPAFTPAPAPEPEPEPLRPGGSVPLDDIGERTVEHATWDDEPDPQPDGEHDELEETPEFLQETPEHDRLWFEQKPPRDFDF